MRVFYPPVVIGHRGAAGSAPENTIASFRRAARLGCRWVEFDVQLSADGVPVVIHDSTLERTTDGRGRVTRTGLERLKSLDAGSWFASQFAGEGIPTLAESLAEMARLGLRPNIEIKAADSRAAMVCRAALAVAAEVWPQEAPPPLISSFAPSALEAAREILPGWPRGYLASRLSFPDLDRARKLECASFHLSRRHAGPREIALLHEKGFSVLVYTVNTKDEAARLFHWGADGVFSDRPEEIIAGNGDSG